MGQAAAERRRAQLATSEVAFFVTSSLLGIGLGEDECGVFGLSGWVLAAVKAAMAAVK